MQNDEGIEQKEEEIIPPKLPFKGEDILESYCLCQIYLPKNPVEAYVVKKKCIEFGKELLPSFIDLTEKDEGQIKRNQEKQDKIDILYKKACVALKTEIPNKRQIKYKYLDKGNRVYELKATDADTCEVVKEELDTVINDFSNQQHEQHMSKLEVVDSEIFHVLTTGDNPVIKPIDPSIDRRIDDIVKLELEKMTKSREEEKNA